MPANTNVSYPGYVSYMPVTIPSGSAAPAEGVDLGDKKLVGITLPAEFDGTAMTFTVATTYSGTYRTLHNGTADLSLTVAASKYIAFSTEVAQNFEGVRYVKPTSGTNQTTTDTVIILHLVPRED